MRAHAPVNAGPQQIHAREVSMADHAHPAGRATAASKRIFRSQVSPGRVVLVVMVLLVQCESLGGEKWPAEFRVLRSWSGDDRRECHD